MGSLFVAFRPRLRGFDSISCADGFKSAADSQVPKVTLAYQQVPTPLAHPSPESDVAPT